MCKDRDGIAKGSSNRVNTEFLRKMDSHSLMNRDILDLNSYERVLLEKEKLRETYLMKFAKEQTEVDDNNNYVVFYPLRAGLGNSLAAMVEALLISMVTHRHFRSRLEWGIIICHFHCHVSMIGSNRVNV